MSQVTGVEDVPAVQATTIPPMTWHGALGGEAKNTTHYLHLSAFCCAKCSGPVIAGSLGTREGDISKEVDVRQIGAVCLACGFRPEIVGEPSVEHRFRPVEWKWAIQEHAEPSGSYEDDPLPAELSQDADTKP